VFELPVDQASFRIGDCAAGRQRHPQRAVPALGPEPTAREPLSRPAHRPLQGGLELGPEPHGLRMRPAEGVDVRLDRVVAAGVVGLELAPGADAAAESARQVGDLTEIAPVLVVGRYGAPQNLRGDLAIRLRRRIGGFVKLSIGIEFPFLAGEPCEHPAFDR
jgi:hypothetical protein